VLSKGLWRKSESVPLLVGGVVLVIFALLSLSASQGEEAKKNLVNTLFGALLMAAVSFVLVRSGLPWVAALLIIFFTAGRRFFASGRQARGTAGRDEAPPPRSRDAGIMSRDEAYAILGVEPGASKDAILEAYKRLMKKMHPDQGGSTYLAQRINLARDVLVGK
jgi:DnaJ-domain-containing protein 1